LTLNPVKVSLNIRETGPVELSIESVYANLKRVALEIEKWLKGYLKSEQFITKICGRFI
jgi:hypothetical protein